MIFFAFNLNDWKSAEESIKQSIFFLNGWYYNNEKREKRESNSEFKQINIFAKTVQGNLLRKTNQTQSAITIYQEVFNLLQSKKSQLNPINSKTKIITFNTIESVHVGLIDLLTQYPSPQNNDLLSKVRESLKNYSYAELDNLLKNNQWEAADKLTYNLHSAPPTVTIGFFVFLVSPAVDIFGRTVDIWQHILIKFSRVVKKLGAIE